jgi:hypothetical protein
VNYFSLKKNRDELLMEMGLKPNLESSLEVPFIDKHSFSPEIAARTNQVAFEVGCPLSHSIRFVDYF